MNIVLVYATYSNSTFMASEVLAEQLRAVGHTVTVELARTAQAGALLLADAVILASPSWDYNGQQGMPHEDFEQFATHLSGSDLTQKPVAIMGLGDSSYQYFCGAVGHLEKLVTNLNGKLIVPSLKIDQYYMNEPAATQQITAWAGSVNQVLSQ